MKGAKRRCKVVAKSPGAGDPAHRAVAAVSGLLKRSEAADEERGSGWNCWPISTQCTFRAQTFFGA